MFLKLDVGTGGEMGSLNLLEGLQLPVTEL